ncbi:hypothetical protein ACES2L_04880 [Bdellovibrio bacteriovorus]
MRTATVIEFPKSQSFRKTLQDKAQDRKAALVLSLASVLITTVFLNQWISAGTDSSLAEGGSRNIASFEPNAFAKDIKWEHSLAKELAADKNKLTGSLAESPTVRDELIFGFLEGRYGMKLAQGRIETLEFIDAQAGEQPMAISDKVEFLNKYADAIGLKYAEVSRVAQNSGPEEVYSLINDEKQIIGHARFTVDEQGRVQQIAFTQ